MNFKLRQLEGFIAAAESRSFSVAADRMCMTQPAFSQLVRELESIVGTRLFDRTTRRIELTEAGRLLLAQARRPLEDLQHAYQDVTELAAGHRGSVSYAILPSAAFSVGTRAIARFRQAHPGVKILQLEDQDRLLMEKVLDREVDFGVGVYRRADAALRFDELFVDELVAVLRVDDALARRRQIGWSDFKDLPLILLPPTSSVRRLVDAGLALEGCQREPAFEVVNMVTAMAMVRQGLGITVLPRIALESMGMEGLVHRRFGEPRPMRRVGIVRRADRVLSAAAERFIACLVEQSAPALLPQPPRSALGQSLNLELAG
ncbi:MAG: LysR family transcriptional regulator [Burkholderiaceae bacterium]|nr:LysR family transcriptional regulator [Burkholderiaceae bacterium]